MIKKLKAQTTTTGGSECLTTQSRMSEWLRLMGDGWGYISKYWALAQK